MTLTLLWFCAGPCLRADTFGLFTYTDNGQSITITDYPTSENGPVVIPDSIIGKPVTSIGTFAFYFCSSLTSVTIPSSVSSIGSRAFFGCSNLTSLTVDAGNSSYKSTGGVLFNKTQTTLIQFPGAKSGSITIPSSVTSIGDRAFYYCSSLTSVTIPASVTSIGAYCFYYCDGLTSITIPASVSSIGTFALHGCSRLTDIKVDAANSSYSSIEGILFNKSQTTLIQCPSGKSGSITIPATVSSIGNSSFISCSNLTSVTIPATVSSIGSSAFGDCSSLTSVTIPPSVASIGSFALASCSSLTEITVDAANSSYSSIDGILFNKTRTTLIQCPGAKAGNITIPVTVTHIGERGFFRCTSLTNVTIPANVNSIGSIAFSGCSSLESVTIPDSVTSIGDLAFISCSSLTSVTIPASVTSIGNSAFSGCSSLVSVTIPASVTSIGDSAFSACSSLASVGILPGVTSIGDHAFNSCSSLTSVTIPAGVTSIGSSAFDRCSSLASVTIPATVTSIGRSAFAACSSLASVAIPAGVATIGDRTFHSCSSLASVTIPSSVTSIGSTAFFYCSSLTSVTIPSNVTSIGSSAFYGCSSLTSINVDVANTNYSSMEGVLFNKTQTTLIQCPSGRVGIVMLPGSVSSISGTAFHGCAVLTDITADATSNSYSSIDGVLFNKSQTDLVKCPGGKAGSYMIPASVSSIGNSAFYSCSSLTSITIPASVSNIGNSAFYSCRSLTTVTIPVSVTSIGNSAFALCSSLTSVAIPANVTSIGSIAFSGCINLTSITVDAANTTYSSMEGVLFNKPQNTLIECPGGKAGSISVPASVTNIGDHSFFGCKSLINVKIPSGVTRIGRSAFDDCSGLTSVTVPASVRSIGSSAFLRCTSLSSAVFIGDAPSITVKNEDGSSFSLVASEFVVLFFDSATGFTLPTWQGYPAINMGAHTPLSPWLITNGFPHDTDTQTDPNDDGVSFLMAYALNLDPRKNLSGSMPKPVISEGEMSLTFYAGSDGITYTVEASSNLESWSTEGVFLSAPDANGYSTAWISTGFGNRFMRLWVYH